MAKDNEPTTDDKNKISDNKEIRNNNNNTIVESGIHYNSAQCGGLPLSCLVDPAHLRQELEMLQRTLEWNNL
jgi:hypothetical protein